MLPSAFLSEELACSELHPISGAFFSSSWSTFTSLTPGVPPSFSSSSPSSCMLHLLLGLFVAHWLLILAQPVLPVFLFSSIFSHPPERHGCCCCWIFFPLSRVIEELLSSSSSSLSLIPLSLPLRPSSLSLSWFCFLPLLPAGDLFLLPCF